MLSSSSWSRNGDVVLQIAQVFVGSDVGKDIEDRFFDLGSGHALVLRVASVTARV